MISYDDKLLSYSAIDIYKMVLSGELSKFPFGFWKSPIDKSNITQCVKYLFEEILKWDEDMIRNNIKARTFKKYRLNTALTLFKGSPYQLINFVYPNKFLPWELYAIARDHNNKEVARTAIKWLIEEKLECKSIDDFKSIKREDFMSNGIHFVLLNYSNHYEAIKDVYPQIERYDLNKLSTGEYNQENALKRIKWYIEEYLNITQISKLYELTIKDFKHPKVSPAIRYFHDNYRKAIMLLYGEDILPWLFKIGAPPNYFSEKENRLKATLWVAYDILHLTKDSLYLLTAIDFKSNKLERMLHDYYSNNVNLLLYDLFGKNKEGMISECKTLVCSKDILEGEVQKGVALTVKQDVFNIIPDTQITVMCNNSEYICNLKNSRITKAKPIFSELDLKAGDKIDIYYVKDSKSMYISKS